MQVALAHAEGGWFVLIGGHDSGGMRLGASEDVTEFMGDGVAEDVGNWRGGFGREIGDARKRHDGTGPLADTEDGEAERGTEREARSGGG